jgi:hypothetical protein
VEEADVRIGMPVEVDFAPCGADLVLPVFKPATP